jgi:hypothetical protein
MLNFYSGRSTFKKQWKKNCNRKNTGNRFFNKVKPKRKIFGPVLVIKQEEVNRMKSGMINNVKEPRMVWNKQLKQILM